MGSVASPLVGDVRDLPPYHGGTPGGWSPVSNLPRPLPGKEGSQVDLSLDAKEALVGTHFTAGVTGMPIVESCSGEATRSYSVAELETIAREMRAWNLLCLHAAGSGHAGGTLSVMDIAAALYLSVIRHDPGIPEWDDRDRVFWSAGHKAPALYIALAYAGYFDKKE